MASRLSVAQIVNKWSQNGQNAGQTVIAGINALTDNPFELAAQQAQKYLRKVTEAVNSGRYEAALRNVNVTEWKQMMTTRGVQRMQEGFQNKAQKFSRFMTNFLPYAREASAQIKAMPRGTMQQAKDRMNRNFDLMSEYRNAGRVGGGRG